MLDKFRVQEKWERMWKKGFIFHEQGRSWVVARAGAESFQVWKAR